MLGAVGFIAVIQIYRDLGKVLEACAVYPGEFYGVQIQRGDGVSFLERHVGHASGDRDVLGLQIYRRIGILLYHDAVADQLFAFAIKAFEADGLR